MIPATKEIPEQVLQEIKCYSKSPPKIQKGSTGSGNFMEFWAPVWNGSWCKTHQKNTNPLGSKMIKNKRRPRSFENLDEFEYFERRPTFSFQPSYPHKFMSARGNFWMTPKVKCVCRGFSFERPLLRSLVGVLSLVFLSLLFQQNWTPAHVIKGHQMILKPWDNETFQMNQHKQRNQQKKHPITLERLPALVATDSCIRMSR